MASYLYDASFEGFLTCIHASYHKEEATGIWPKGEYPGSLFEKPEEIHTSPEKAEKVYLAIQNKISKSDLRRIYRVFNSNLPEKEMKLLAYIKLGFQLGSKVSLHHANPTVKIIEETQRKVGREIDRMLGLVRFSSLEGGILYAPIEPDHDLLEFIAEHFSDRLKSEAFILHDTGRGKAVVAQGGKWYISDFGQKELDEFPGFSKDEKELRLLWKKYFDAIAIKERTNSRCQKNFMPVRYWKNLTEMG